MIAGVDANFDGAHQRVPLHYWSRAAIEDH